jgi:hypothetical protein
LILSTKKSKKIVFFSPGYISGNKKQKTLQKLSRFCNIPSCQEEKTMNERQLISIFQSDASSEGIILRPGKSAEFKFNGCGLEADAEYRLFVTGETTLNYLWKNEPDYHYQYRTADDALNTTEAEKAPYCLDLSNSREVNYQKLLYKKVMWPPILSYLGYRPKDDVWSFGLRARAKDLSVHGYIRMTAEIRLIKDGRNIHSTEGYPDYTAILDIPGGTYPWRQLSMPVEIPGDSTASVGIFIEGYGYEGGLYIEAPFLETSDRYNLLPGFEPSVPDKEKFVWTAINLSRKEWPEFTVKLNGKKVFSGEVFERCHRRSEWAVNLNVSDMVSGENSVSIALVSDYHDALPYSICELGLIPSSGGEFQLLAVPETAAAGGDVPVLIRTKRKNVKINVECDSAITIKEPLYFPDPGLHVLRFRCGNPAINAAFTLRDDRGIALKGVIKRVVERQPDGVVTGTGDLIYVKQERAEFEDFFIWYCANHIGNLMTIRPAYRWSGGRVLNPEAWTFLASLLNGMNMSYAHIIDGRELPGIDANPHRELLEGKGFLGSQLHEQDGAWFYWGKYNFSSMTEEQSRDLEQRFFRDHPENTSPRYASSSYHYYDGQVWHYRTPAVPRDMRAAAEYSVNALRQNRYGAARHTGPSVMFKYFYQAGFDWVGAETMYTSMEPLMAFLRGAALGYNRKSIGVHHAVQWSTSPHDTEERFRRYRLALYTSYIQGATEINTEEGLWHMEEYYACHNRFGRACRGHQKEQQDFYRWISTHSRTGTFHATMAVLHGRLDGWHGFGRDKPWGLFDTPDGDPEKSWDLLRFFYPLSKPGESLYFHNCPVKPLGYYSGTPRGNIDAIPIEGDLSVLSRYRALSLLGYNCAEKEDLDKLWAYMEGGGKLILGWPHLITTTDRQDLVQYRHHYIDHQLVTLAGGMPAFTEISSERGSCSVFTGLSRAGKTLEKTAEGIPLIQKYAVGRGELYFINTMEYPAVKAVCPLYEKALTMVSDALIREEPSFIRCNEDVEFAIYDQDDRSCHIYVLAVDWYNPPEALRKAELLIGNVSYGFSIPFGVLLKMVISDQTAAWPLSEDGDVLSLWNGKMKVQGTGVIDFQYAAGGVVQTLCVNFTNDPVQEIVVIKIPHD